MIKFDLSYTNTLARSLPAYFGGKRKIIKNIFSALSPSDGDIIIDPMAGSMVLPLVAKHQKYVVLANDRSPGSTVIGQALLENNTHTIDLKLLPQLILPSNNSGDRFIEQNYGDIQLPRQLAVYVDNIHENVEYLPKETQSMYRLLMYRFLTLMAPYNLFRYPGLTKGYLNDTYPVSMQKHIDRWNDNIKNPLPLLVRIANQLNEAVGPGEGYVYQQDVFSFLDQVNQGDILYLDPPYAGAGIPYEEGYRVINNMITRQLNIIPISVFNDIKQERQVLQRLLLYGHRYNTIIFSYWTELHDRSWFGDLFEDCGLIHREIELDSYSYSYSTKVGKKGQWDQQKNKGQKEILYKLTPKK